MYYKCNLLVKLILFGFQQNSIPRGVIEIKKCLSIKGADDTINKHYAFELSTVDDSMFFIADSEKVNNTLKMQLCFIQYVVAKTTAFYSSLLKDMITLRIICIV